MRVFAALISIAACGGTERPPTTPATASQRAASNAALEAYVDVVESLPRRGNTEDHRQLVDALQALATTLDAVVGPGRGAQVRALAMELDLSRPGTHHAPIVVDAIAVALQELRATTSSSSAYAHALRAYEELAPSEPLLRQSDRAQRALEALANALAVVAGRPPPFEVVALDGVPASRQALRDRASRLHDLVEQAASAPRSEVARARIVEALRTLAEAIRVAPAALERSRVASLASPVAFAALRLEQVGGTSLERTDYAASGLQAAAAALQEIASAPGDSALGQLTERAKTAAEAIDEHSTFGFQRPQIQDALRAMAAAYLVFAAES